MTNPETIEDAILGTYCYCKSHVRPHGTGWCSVPNDMKIALKENNFTEAMSECKDLKLRLYMHCNICYVTMKNWGGPNNLVCSDCK